MTDLQKFDADLIDLIRQANSKKIHPSHIVGMLLLRTVAVTDQCYKNGDSLIQKMLNLTIAAVEEHERTKHLAE